MNLVQLIKKFRMMFKEDYVFTLRIDRKKLLTSFKDVRQDVFIEEQ